MEYIPLTKCVQNKPFALEEALSIVNGSRNADYGDSNENLKRIATIATAMGQTIDAEGVVKVLISVKLARQMHKKKRDNLVDLAGYVELWSRLLADASD